MAHGDGRPARAVEVVWETAVWSHTGLPPVPLRWVLIRWVLIRDPHGQCRTHALRWTEWTASPVPLRAWFVPRWQLAVPFQAMRAHLGLAPPRQWTPLAMARPTPALFGLCSLVTRRAHPAFSSAPVPLPHTAWSTTPLPTCADALALVRPRLWAVGLFPTSPLAPDPETMPATLLDHLCHRLCSALRLALVQV